MPSCFSLTRRGDSGRANLQNVDRDICQNLDFPYSEDRWAYNWYNFIGLALAMGHSFDYIIDLCWKYGDWESLRIAAYLNDNYTADNWKEYK